MTNNEELFKTISSEIQRSEYQNKIQKLISDVLNLSNVEVLSVLGNINIDEAFRIEETFHIPTDVDYSTEDFEEKLKTTILDQIITKIEIELSKVTKTVKKDFIRYIICFKKDLGKKKWVMVTEGLGHALQNLFIKNRDKLVVVPVSGHKFKAYHWRRAPNIKISFKFSAAEGGFRLITVVYVEKPYKNNECNKYCIDAGTIDG